MLYGDVAVPIHERPWQAGPLQPYRQTYHLKPGESWHQATTTDDQREHYVQLESGAQIPVGAMIARELMADGASGAYFTELWIRFVLMSPDLVCVEPRGEVEQFLLAMRDALGGRLAGLPDALAFFPDGRVVLREAKNVGAKDRLQPTQHEFARVARRLFGQRVDLAVVEWGRGKTE
jgi:hypothetical protein